LSVTLCQLIQLSKSFGLGFRRSAPFPTGRSNLEPTGRGLNKSTRTRNKKPGVERRANSSTHIGRICAMLDSLLSGIRKRPRSESGEGLENNIVPWFARQVPSSSEV
jgi:hypothetical protein